MLLLLLLCAGMPAAAFQRRFSREYPALQVNGWKVGSSSSSSSHCQNTVIAAQQQGNEQQQRFALLGRSHQ
jgi:hypothetical protein